MTRHFATQPHRSLPLLLLAALITLVFGCAEFDSSAGSDIASAVDEGELREMFIPADDVTTYIRGDVPKTSSASLILGEQDGFQSDLYYRYGTLDALGDTVLAIDSGYVMLYSAGYVDEDAVTDPTEWRAEVTRVDDSFDHFTADRSTFEGLTLTPVDTLLLGSWAPDDSTGESWRVDLDDVTLSRWLQDTLSYGLYIRPLDSPQFLKLFSQRAPIDTARIPTLNVLSTFVAGDDTLTEWVEITPDFSSFYTRDDDLVPTSGRVLFSQGYSRQMLFRGDFSVLDPTLHSINRVDLVTFVDKEYDRNLGTVSSITWYDVTSDWTTTPDTVKLGIPSGLFYAIPDEGNRLRFNVTPVTRAWVSQPDSNRGVLVRPSVLGLRAARAAFYDNTAADSTLRPYFHVTYTEFEAP